ncbi:FHA domain-containing protein [Thermosynechococcus sp. HN-54]|uniref:FHA domain-containing protein n=1 Tax=Thermosynechococcus sp. HN-54 TaxID=2933959 RepID=UPI00202CA8C8|nr:FHA domain-containing protein [Thermosynechococcus sp. HN-54]URR36056.1 FHA domain-containing protein [Thermosynechococcus sp. HN-54]
MASHSSEATVLASDQESSPFLQISTPASVEEFPLLQPVVRVGRSPHNEIVISYPTISRHHFEIVKTDTGYRIRDLDSKLGLVYGDRPLKEKDLKDGDTFYIGANVKIVFRESQVQFLQKSISFQGKTVLRIGRGDDNDIRIDHPQISRHHAKIERQGTSIVITDLNSSNGVFCNGKRLTKPHALRIGDKIRIGPYLLQINVDETITVDNETGSIRLDAFGLEKVVKGNKKLLHDVSLSILPREFVVVAGVSGCGKSTLLRALTGFNPASSGTVLVNGNDLYHNFDAYRSQFAYVPQEDIVHKELTVEEALDFAAQLRMPADITPTERHSRVEEVMQILGLSQRRDVPIKNLSGGQLKRVSIGVELITKPSLFFLDEATSGLDPGTEADVMSLLRRLANDGCTVVLITHVTENIKLCNLVLFLAAGGRIAYFGPPDQAAAYFGVNSFNDIYPLVERERSPEEWQQRYLNSPQYKTYVLDRQKSVVCHLDHGRTPDSQGKRASKIPQYHPVSGLRQYLILLQREAAVLMRDRVSLILNFSIPFFIGLLDLIIWDREVFDIRKGDAATAITMLFATALVAVMVGNLTTMREIAKEREIYRREHLVGLKIGAYVFSKTTVALLLALYQASAFLLFKNIAIDFPGDSLTQVQLWITMFLASFSGMMMGLLVSALSPNTAIAPLLLILFIIPQVTFGGGIIAPSQMNPIGQVMNLFTLTKWPFEAFVTITELGKDVALDPCWIKPNETHSADTCRCTGAQLFKTCYFPGVRGYYTPALDEPEPQKPPEPATPTTPAAFATFQQEMTTYKDDLEVWQEQYSNWMLKREKAIGQAEGIIDRLYNIYGEFFDVNVQRHWLMIVLFIVLMFGMIVGIQIYFDTLH